MRQRKVKNLEEKLEAASELRITSLEECKGRWHKIFGNDHGMYLELGCGKGQFLIGHALQNPQNNYIGIEGQDSVVLRALEKACETGINNIRFAGLFVKKLDDIFEPGELEGMYLNFSDPWPKLRHAKRRLTYHAYLQQYKKIICPGGFLEFKTDNDNLFEFTLEEVKAYGFQISEMSRNLHETAFESAKITTEYEDKFKMNGKTINYLKIQY